MSKSRIVTAESVTAGHADKLCDQIADRVLDAILCEDRYARVSCEVLVSTGMVVVTGQITTKCYVDINAVVRETLRSVGYNDPAIGFDHRSCAVVVLLEEQSAEVALGVDRKGAGDQGTVLGYASDEGRELPVDTHFMPVATWLANRLALKLSEVRESGVVASLYPDGKVQVAIRYVEGKPHKLVTIVLSAHHHSKVDLEALRQELRDKVIIPVVSATGLLDDSTEILINPVGPFAEGGPRADSGLTGRKNGVDCYGSACPHGGSALSGKDPTKPDRSGAYGARWVAKNLVAAGLAHRCSVEISYVIGLPAPLSVEIDSYGTGLLDDEELSKIVRSEFDLSPAGIIESLDLRRPIYGATATYGHFGRDNEDFSWETLSHVDRLVAYKRSRS